MINLPESLPKLQTSPYRHVIWDNFLDEDVALNLASNFPGTKATWFKYENPFERKFLQDDLAKMPSIHRQIFALLNTSLFTRHLEEIFDMPGLISDPSLRGGGLHLIEPGGKLDIHCDFNWHKHLKLDRRLNALLYLNWGWQSDWGGQLELWRPDMSLCEVRITPVFNRMVVFETTDFSYHGHPDPLRCPPEIARKSMAWYFYTNGRPEAEKSAPHAACFKARPEDETTSELDRLRELRNQGSENIQKEKKEA